MKTIPTPTRLLAASLAVAALLSLPTAARGGTITLSVDPTRSSLTLSGGLTISGVWPYSQQAAGSLVDSFGGTITATTTGGGGLSFSGGSSIQALLNPASPLTPSGTLLSVTFSGTDNYGTLSLPFGNLWYDAYRDLKLDISAGTASAGGDPASGMTLGFTAGHNDFYGPAFGLAGNNVIVGSGGPNWPIAGGVNGSAGNVTFDGTTLTVPVKLVTESFNGNGLLMDETWTGQIVAVVPEPSFLALVGLGLAALAAQKLRRSQRS